MSELNVDSIFGRAIEIEDEAARTAFVGEACGDDAVLQARVCELLAAHFKESEFMDKPAGDLAATVGDPAPTDQTGSRIGPYKLLDQIGEGGMGVVYMAEQKQPVKRRVALKIIKPGMDTRQVIARFETERQALAMMDHPNIAKVLDAGSTESGRPYFVMELVNGISITRYCDEQHLNPRERLEIFIPVCHAVQHAHHKGIIHRDLKPSNILVALYDGKPVPKVIDFGVAKATHQTLTEMTLLTKLGQIVGTWEYMSPEQAQRNQLDIDTRSDIYSLGALIYELLTGTTPFDKRRLRSAALDELLRIIREEEPPRPSIRLSSIDTLPSVAANRRVEPRKLTLLLRGELDWIVMKAMEKDRGRRYKTAESLAADVRHYLDHEPVEACPPSRAYRMHKFARKHRMGVAAALGIFAALTVGLLTTSVGFTRAIQERKRAEENLYVACNLVNDAIYPAVLNLQYVPYAESVHQSLLNKAVDFYEQVLQQAPDDPVVRHGLAVALKRLSNYRIDIAADAETPCRRAIAILAQLVDEHPDVNSYRTDLAHEKWKLARINFLNCQFSRAAEMMSPVIAFQEETARLFPSDRQDLRYVGHYYAHRGWMLVRGGHLTEGASDLVHALNILEPTEFNDRHDEVLARYELAEILMRQGRFDEAGLHLDELQRIAPKLLEQAEKGEKPRPYIEVRPGGRAIYQFWLALVYERAAMHSLATGDLAKAEEQINTAVEWSRTFEEISEKVFWKAYVQGLIHCSHSEILAAIGKRSDAIAAARLALAEWEHSSRAADQYNAGLAHWRLGELLYDEGSLEEANLHFSKALEEFNRASTRLPEEPFCNERLVVFLSTCPIESFRDPARAAERSRQLVSPSNGLMGRNLGLASYRAGDWAGAEQAIRTSMNLCNGGDAIDWLLLAASQHQSGRDDEAAESINHAQDLIHRAAPIYYGDIGVLGYQRLRAEVEQLLLEDIRATSETCHETRCNPLSQLVSTGSRLPRRRASRHLPLGYRRVNTSHSRYHARAGRPIG